MDHEGLETLRVPFIKKALEAMDLILKDKKATIDQKIAAGRLIHDISDTIVKARIVTEEGGVVEKTAGKLIKQLEKLDQYNDELEP